MAETSAGLLKFGGIMSNYDMQLINDIKILSSKTNLIADENTLSFNIDAKVVVIPTKRKNFSEVDLDKYYETLYEEKGIGWIDIVFGTMALVTGVFFVATGFLMVGVSAALMIAGGVFTLGSGATGIAAGILRPVSPRLANILAYVSIGLGVAGMITGVTAAHKAGLIAARSAARLMNSRVLTTSTTARQIFTTPIVADGGFSCGAGAILTAAVRATSTGIAALDLAIAGSGSLLAITNAAHEHGIRNKARRLYEADLEKLNSGGIS